MKLKKLTALITILTLIFSLATITALADWVEDIETPPIEIMQGDTPPADGDGYEWRLVDIRIEQGAEINGRYIDAEINGRYIDAEINGRYIGAAINGRYVDGACLGYEKIFLPPGTRVVEVEGDSGDSGSYSGTPENGQKFGEQSLWQTELGITTTTSGSNPTITVPQGVTVIVRVQNGNRYTYVEVTGPFFYQTNGNNAWIHDVFENGVNNYDEHKGFKQVWTNDGYEQIRVNDGFLQIWVNDGFEQIWVNDGYIQIRVNDGFEQIRVNDGLEEIVYEIFQRFIWVEDEEVFIERETGEEYSLEEAIVEILTTTVILTAPTTFLPVPATFEAAEEAAVEVIVGARDSATEETTQGIAPAVVYETIEDYEIPLEFTKGDKNIILSSPFLIALLLLGIALLMLIAFRKRQKKEEEIEIELCGA